MARLIIAERYDLMREGLLRVLQPCTDIDIISEVRTEAELTTALLAKEADVVLLDPSLACGSTEELINKIRCAAPSIKILVFASHCENESAVRLLRIGIHGYLSKKGTPAELIEAVRRVALGRPYVSIELGEQIALSVMKSTHEFAHARLSARELQIFVLLVQGKTVTQISKMLDLSVKTVSTHKSRIKERMGLRTLSEFVQYAIAHGLVQSAGTDPQHKPLVVVG